jgi:hypothetical protein
MSRLSPTCEAIIEDCLLSIRSTLQIITIRSGQGLNVGPFLRRIELATDTPAALMDRAVLQSWGANLDTLTTILTLEPSLLVEEKQALNQVLVAIKRSLYNLEPNAYE